MKKYSFKTRELRELDAKQGVYDPLMLDEDKNEIEYLISSKKFVDEFKGYIDDIARYKNVGGRKFARSTEYAAIGIMDSNDIYQEAYLAFLEAYNSLDTNKSGGEKWNFLKKTTALNFEKQLRSKKDGIRMPERVYFDGSNNVNIITGLFSQLEKVFANNVQEVALTKYETDLTGSFLDIHMDDYLDLTREGNRDMMKNERAIIKSLYGLDEPRMTYKEVSEYYKVGQSTVRKVKERAIKRLKSEESKTEIASFLHEYRINT